MRDSLGKGKYLANSYNAATVNVNYKLSSFFQCYFKNGTEILMTVWEFFFQESFLEGRFHISMNERSHFQWGIHFQVERAPHRGSICFDGRGQKNYGVRFTPIMALPTRTNSGLCCNRIKKKHESTICSVKFTRKRSWLYEKKSFFTDKFSKHSLNL